MARSDEQQQAHNNWLTDIKQAKRNVREWLYEAEISGIDPERAVFPDTENTPVHELHAAILDYQDQLRPFRKAVPDMWTEPLTEIHTQIGTQEISLDSLAEWRGRYETVKIESTNEITGANTSTRRYRVWIPWRASAHCNQQLNDILDELNLAAELPEQESMDTPSTVPDHVKQEAPAYQS